MKMYWVKGTIAAAVGLGGMTQSYAAAKVDLGGAGWTFRTTGDQKSIYVTVPHTWLIMESYSKFMMLAYNMRMMRIAHCLQMPALSEFADKHGMLIIAEAANWNMSSWKMADTTIRKRLKNRSSS